jgi:integrase
MDLPVVEYSEEKRPSLKATTVSILINGSAGQEQALYVLLAATGMRISEALGLEVRHIINDGRTIKVEQQIEKDRPQSGTPHLYGNLEDRWLMPRLVKLKLDEEGMGWHAFKSFRKTWLRSARCLELRGNQQFLDGS